ncbi:MAG: DUF2855 family protein [Pseudomonadota bacterium]
MTDTSYHHCIHLDAFRHTEILDGFVISPDALEEGQVMVKVDKVALTSNSVSYVIGSQQGLMPWLEAFPAPEGLGHIPCWGFGDVLYSRHPDVPEGERLYGFFPIASHVVLTPGKTHDRGFTDSAAHRQGLAAFYNEYSYIRKEAGYAAEFEDVMMLFRPLFGTSYLLESYCEDHGFFDAADRILISSASSKTAMGFGYLLRKNHAGRVRAIGLTSTRNKDFVVGLDCYDEILTYDALDNLEANAPSVFFDIAGNRDVQSGVHRQLGDTLVYSGQVGQTHWDDKDKTAAEALPGPSPVFWSGPDQVMLMRERHGEKGFMKLVQASMIEFMLAAFNWIKMLPSEGPEALDARVKSMLEGEIKADEGVILKP